METRKAVGYLRVSTENQATEGVSLEAQEAKIRAYCQLNDLDLTAIHTDAGISGKRADNRPGLQLALKACDQGMVLVVYSLSRLARSTRDTINLAERLKNSGSDLVSLSEKIDTTTAVGRMFFRLMAILAEFELEQLTERTKAALDHKRSKGQRIGTIPFGYRLGEDGKSLEIDDAEQQALELMRAHQAQGLSMKGISEALAGAGIMSRKGTPFDPSSIWYVLKRAA